MFVWRALRNFAMADFEENVEEMVGTIREAASGDRVRRGRKPGTKPAVPAVPGTKPATRRRRRLVMNETAATGGVMYPDEGELEFESTSAMFVWRTLRNFAMADFEKSVEEMVGTTSGEWRQSPAGTIPGTRPSVPGTRLATRRRRRLVTNKTAATGGGNVYGRRGVRL